MRYIVSFNILFQVGTGDHVHVGVQVCQAAAGWGGDGDGSRQVEEGHGGIQPSKDHAHLPVSPQPGQGCAGLWSKDRSRLDLFGGWDV